MKIFSLGILSYFISCAQGNNNYTPNLRHNQNPLQQSININKNVNKNNSVNFLIINYDIIYESPTNYTSPCCLVCEPGKSMYYSIDENTNLCGQTCINDNMYFLYKLFEPGLTKADHILICPRKGYEKYVSTVTHGVFFLKDTLDLYEPFQYYDFRNMNY